MAIAATNTGHTARTAQSAWRGRLTSSVAVAAVVLFGEAGLIAVTGVGRQVAHGVNAEAWLVATILNALAGYFLVGLPQIKAWGRGGNVAKANATNDPRARFAARTLTSGGLAAFVLASIVGGPLAVGWFYGRRLDPRARSLTWAAAWLLAGVWSAVYLGLLSVVF
jgi:hypothetical protein